MKELTIPEWVADEVEEMELEYDWWGILEFNYHGLVSNEFDNWIDPDNNANNIDILMAYLNPLTRDLVEVIE